MKKEKKKHQLKITLFEEKQAKAHKISEIEHCYFPYFPYQQQVDLIKIINMAVSKKQNALVESPTGTGKTLCMLVGALSSLVGSPKPKIYYLTRTHSQITQVISQLKKTVYNCRANVIASRDQLCINPNLQELKGRILDKACQQLCQQKLCKYREVNDQRLKQTLTIDEMREKGKKKFICPFFLTKASTQSSEITILPFNYLLDWNLFEKNNFSLKDSVIIFDEAHNIDVLAEEGSSFQLSTQLISHVIRELKNLQQSVKCRYLHKKFSEDDSFSLEVQDCKYFFSNFFTQLKNIEKQIQFLNKYDVLEKLKEMTSFQNPKTQEKHLGIDLGNYDEFLDQLNRVDKIFINKRISHEHFQFCKICLTNIFQILDSEDFQHYSVSISQKQGRIFMKFHCLNASFGFEKIKKSNPKSIVLCSGTLSPLNLWETDLNLKFQYKISIPSFVSRCQIYSVILSETKSQEKYDFSFQKKNRQTQYECLAKELKAIEKIVPNGIIVAFSTYQLMEKTMSFCLTLEKKVFYEKKNINASFIFEQYSEQAKKNGAFLFIIMKGRFSEGINFNDELCRCLVIVGIPFLPMMDFKIGRKKTYIQQNFDREQADQWYMTQTFRTVNQVLGRVIRSKKDYGSIILVDNRYNREEIFDELPTWFKKSLKKGSEKYTEGLKKFFQAQSWENEEYRRETQSKETIAILPPKKGEKYTQILNEQTPKIEKKKKKKKPKLLIRDTDDRSDSLMTSKKEETHPWNNIDFFINEDMIKDACHYSDSEEEGNEKINTLNQRSYRTKFNYF